MYFPPPPRDFASFASASIRFWLYCIAPFSLSVGLQLVPRARRPVGDDRRRLRGARDVDGAEHVAPVDEGLADGAEPLDRALERLDLLGQLPVPFLLLQRLLDPRLGDVLRL